jgi:hypothetical protein
MTIGGRSFRLTSFSDTACGCTRVRSIRFRLATPLAVARRVRSIRYCLATPLAVRFALLRDIFEGLWRSGHRTASGVAKHCYIPVFGRTACTIDRREMIHLNQATGFRMDIKNQNPAIAQNWTFPAGSLDFSPSSAELRR